MRTKEQFTGLQGFDSKRPGLQAAWTIERSKGRNGFFLVAVTFVALMGQFLGGWNYVRYQEYFTTPEMAWLAIWVQGSILVTTIFLPLVFVVVQANIAAAEHEFRGWLRTVSIDRVGVAITGKILYALELAFLGMGIYLVATISTGFLLGLSPEGLGPLVVRAGVAVLSAWSIGAAMMLVGIIFTSFSTMTFVGVAGIIAGLAITVSGSSIAGVIPFSAITVGMGARETTSLLNPVGIVTSILSAVVWIVGSAAATRRLLRQREW